MRFSIIIPVYNRVAFLPRLFASLTALTYRPLQIILIDDGSVDGSLDCCRNFQAQPHTDGLHITVLNGGHKGACAARNAGVHAAEGDYLYFFDSDDEMSPDFFRDVEQALASAPSADLVCARVRLYFPDGTTRVRDSLFSASPSHQIISAMLSTQSMVIRKSFFQACGGWDEALARWNDWELGTRLLLRSPKVVWLERVYHKIHQHEASITGRSFSLSSSDLKKSIEAVLKDTETANLSCEELRKTHKALALKATLLAAAIRRDNAPMTAQAMRRWAVSRLFPSASLADRLILYAAFRYASAGGRGAWRLYRFL